MGIFVLVPGACHGSWCYSRVAERLRRLGHDVFAPPLTGVGELAHLCTNGVNLSTHIDDVTALIESHSLVDVVLCGHSYGGMVITGVAGRIGDRIRSLVYLDGLVPEDGQSSFDIIGADRAMALIRDAGANGLAVEPPDATLFNVNPADLDWVNAKCTPQPIGTLIQRLHFTGKEALVANRTFIVATRYRSSANHNTYDRLRETAGWKTASIDSGHDMMIDAPEALAGLLVEELN
ncbi:alpha/beta fold hydrolase [Flavisphingomonas formosensis]|uniref:alpha/beta fold hydrolase n=1 Tax=Flavisphingomonas formosensis TaxID=861534 RepID=UPI0012F72A86|nr:alpha/beta hydrolase [Sphingomonas formosensis]